MRSGFENLLNIRRRLKRDPSPHTNEISHRAESLMNNFTFAIEFMLMIMSIFLAFSLLTVNVSAYIHELCSRISDKSFLFFSFFLFS